MKLPILKDLDLGSEIFTPAYQVSVNNRFITRHFNGVKSNVFTRTQAIEYAQATGGMILFCGYHSLDKLKKGFYGA